MTAEHGHPLRVLWVAGEPRACCCRPVWWQVVPNHGGLPGHKPATVRAA